MKKEESCRKCSVVSKVEALKTEMVKFSDGTTHKRASCPECGSFIKWLRHTTPKLFVGKYKGKDIDWIAENDPEYLKWFLNQNIKLDLRMTIGDILREKGVIK